MRGSQVADFSRLHAHNAPSRLLAFIIYFRTWAGCDFYDYFHFTRTRYFAAFFIIITVNASLFWFTYLKLHLISRWFSSLLHFHTFISDFTFIFASLRILSLWVSPFTSCRWRFSLHSRSMHQGFFAIIGIANCGFFLWLHLRLICLMLASFLSRLSSQWMPSSRTRVTYFRAGPMYSNFTLILFLTYARQARYFSIDTFISGIRQVSYIWMPTFYWATSSSLATFFRSKSHHSFPERAGCRLLDVKYVIFCSFIFFD